MAEIFGVSEKHIKHVERYLASGPYTCNMGYTNELMEECGELIKSLGKYTKNFYAAQGECNFDDFAYERDNIIEEMAHVLISLSVLANRFGISVDKIDREIDEKEALLND